MNVAYFSTAAAIGSCSSYSRFTISGGLLMMDIDSSPVRFGLCGTGGGQDTWCTEREGDVCFSCTAHPLAVPLVEGRMPIPDEIGVKGNRSIRCQLLKLSAQLRLGETPRAPGVVRAFEALAVEPLPRFREKLQIFRYRDHVFVPLPLPANMEV